jgi:hypothetical protein
MQTHEPEALLHQVTIPAFADLQSCFGLPQGREGGGQLGIVPAQGRELLQQLVFGLGGRGHGSFSVRRAAPAEQAQAR